jgi:hypothetical protein
MDQTPNTSMNIELNISRKEIMDMYNQYVWRYNAEPHEDPLYSYNPTARPDLFVYNKIYMEMCKAKHLKYQPEHWVEVLFNNTPYSIDEFVGVLRDENTHPAVPSLLELMSQANWKVSFKVFRIEWRKARKEVSY